MKANFKVVLALGLILFAVSETRASETLVKIKCILASGVGNTVTYHTRESSSPFIQKTGLLKGSSDLAAGRKARQVSLDIPGQAQGQALFDYESQTLHASLQMISSRTGEVINFDLEKEELVANESLFTRGVSTKLVKESRIEVEQVLDLHCNLVRRSR